MLLAGVLHYLYYMYGSGWYCAGLTSDYYQGVSSIGHDVEAGGNHLLVHGILDPNTPDYARTTDYLEDRWFFIPGLAGYPEAKMAEDWFDYGGFPKLQQYYTRSADLYALRDDFKPFIRTYFNSIFPLLSQERMALWEHYHTTGGWNKTHETGWSLAQTRTMLVQERGDTLWLAPFATSNWLRQGMVVSAQAAPTRFGPVSFRLESDVDHGVLRARVTPPQRQAPAALVLRLRHPDGLAIRRVILNGARWTEFGPDTVRLPPDRGDLEISVTFRAR